MSEGQWYSLYSTRRISGTDPAGSPGSSCISGEAAPSSAGRTSVEGPEWSGFPQRSGQSTPWWGYFWKKRIKKYALLHINLNNCGIILNHGGQCLWIIKMLLVPGDITTCVANIVRYTFVTSLWGCKFLVSMTNKIHKYLTPTKNDDFTVHVVLLYKSEINKLDRLVQKYIQEFVSLMLHSYPYCLTSHPTNLGRSIPTELAILSNYSGKKRNS